MLIFLDVSSAETDFSWGTNFRLRHEYWKNIFDVDSGAKDNRNYFRLKPSLWGKKDFIEDISLYAKLTDEFKAYTYFYQTASMKKGFRFDINEVIFDNLYLDVKNLLGMPVDLRFGRQDFLSTYGEGFLIMDGTPYDGSRTFYFNALKTTWHLNEENDLDFVYINNPRDDLYLPIINEDKSPQRLNITDEEAFVLYLKNKSIENCYLEGYYIFKTEEDDGGVMLQAQDGEINTFGSFAKYDFDHFTLRGQYAFQFGDYGSNDRIGSGWYLFLDRSFKDQVWSPSISAGYIYLSGDEPASAKNEGWDPLFSRWPWMSELYSLSYNSESGLDYWTNLQMCRLELMLAPNEKSKIYIWYNYLRANETPSGNMFGTGKERGHLPQAKFSYNFSKNISAYFLVEYFMPGNFYYADNDSSALFLRTEFSLKF